MKKLLLCLCALILLTGCSIELESNLKEKGYAERLYCYRGQSDFYDYGDGPERSYKAWVIDYDQDGNVMSVYLQKTVEYANDLPASKKDEMVAEGEKSIEENGCNYDDRWQKDGNDACKAFWNENKVIFQIEADLTKDETKETFLKYKTKEELKSYLEESATCDLIK